MGYNAKFKMGDDLVSTASNPTLAFDSAAATLTITIPLNPSKVIKELDPGSAGDQFSYRLIPIANPIAVTTAALEGFAVDGANSIIMLQIKVPTKIPGTGGFMFRQEDEEQ